jgi:hypothetical protein
MPSTDDYSGIGRELKEQFFCSRRLAAAPLMQKGFASQKEMPRPKSFPEMADKQTVRGRHRSAIRRSGFEFR